MILRSLLIVATPYAIYLIRPSRMDTCVHACVFVYTYICIQIYVDIYMYM